MTTTTESGGRQNMFPTETRPYIDENANYEGYPQNAEKVNGRWAMIGFVALPVLMQPQVRSFWYLLMNYWKNAEQINGRLAMIGLFAAVVNY